MKKGISLALALAPHWASTARRWRRHLVHRQPSLCRESPAAGTEAPPPRNRHHHLLNADKEAVELEVPYDPQRTPFWTWPPGYSDVLAWLGCVAGSWLTPPDYLQSYVTDENGANLGTIKPPIWRRSWPPSPM